MEVSATQAMLLDPRDRIAAGAMPHDVVGEQLVERCHVAVGDCLEKLADDSLIRMSHGLPSMSFME